MKFHAILAAVDGGDQTQAVLDLASSLVDGNVDAVIHVLCVADILPATIGGMAGATDLSIVALQGMAESTIKEATAALAQKGIQVEGHVVLGNTPHMIIDQARAFSCDVIVLGHRHRAFWARVFEQSICLQILEHAPCPLMIATLT